MRQLSINRTRSELSSVTNIDSSDPARPSSITDYPIGSPQAASSPNVSTSSPIVSTSSPNVSTSSPNVSTSSPNVSTKTQRKRTKKKDNFKITIVNCQSVKNKIADLHTFISGTDPDVVLGTESWLKADILSSEVFPDGYAVYRKDCVHDKKDKKDKKKESGGGVFVLVRKEFTSHELKISTTCELIFVNLKMADQQDLKIGCLYRPPWAEEDYMEAFGDAMMQVDPHRKGNIWIGGDFNLPHIDWEHQKILKDNPHVKLSKLMINITNDFSLTQVVDLPTRKENLLDLFFTTNPTLIQQTKTLPPLTEEADHDIALIDINTRALIPKQKKSPRFTYGKADWESMKGELNMYQLPDTTVQAQWNHMEAALKSLMKKFIPRKTPRPSKHKPWITREIITTTHRRDRAYSAWKRSKSQERLDNYRKLSAQCQKMIRKAHTNYTEDIFNLDNSDNEKPTATKKFWSYIKSQKKDSCSVSPLKSDGLLISDSKGKSNILNKQYCSVFTTENTENMPSKGESSSPILSSIKVTESGVRKMLQNLNPRKASGPDEISPMVLKTLADQLSKPLADLFQHSIQTGSVPAQWKQALVTPIFKKGDRTNAANYRPVSLTSVCCKLCEHIVARAIMQHLEENDLLADQQHGFRKNRSCESQLLLFVDELVRELAKGRQTDVAVMDFSKAFDVVPHKRLLYKLKYYGIRGSTLKWIEDFLTGRTQQVVVDGEVSDVAPVTSGVPQGSVLGPFLFLAFINDMPECVTSRCRLFADDSIIYRKVDNDDDAGALQKDLDALQKWESDWGMSFNPIKCNTIHVSRKRQPSTHVYTLKETPLETVADATYLGVTLSDNLDWHKQTAKVVAKANRSLGFVRRNVRTATKETKVLAYQALVRPITEYASTVWSPHQRDLIQDLEMTQRRAARYVTKQYGRHDSVTKMLEDLGWETLEQRRAKARTVMTYRIVNGLVAIPDSQMIPTTEKTRGHSKKFRQIGTKTNYHKHSFFPSSITLWNSLPDSLATADSIEIFRTRLKDTHIKLPQR